jgi:hypothetical protein
MDEASNPTRLSAGRGLLRAGLPRSCRSHISLQGTLSLQRLRSAKFYFSRLNFRAGLLAALLRHCPKALLHN